MWAEMFIVCDQLHRTNALPMKCCPCWKCTHEPNIRTAFKFSTWVLFAKPFSHGKTQFIRCTSLFSINDAIRWPIFTLKNHWFSWITFRFLEIAKAMIVMYLLKRTWLQRKELKMGTMKYLSNWLGESLRHLDARTSVVVMSKLPFRCFHSATYATQAVLTILLLYLRMKIMDVELILNLFLSFIIHRNDCRVENIFYFIGKYVIKDICEFDLNFE